jgi:hypothetical protein
MSRIRLIPVFELQPKRWNEPLFTEPVSDSVGFELVVKGRITLMSWEND